MNPPVAHNNLEAALASALQALQHGDIQAALSSFQAMLAVEPRHGMANYWLGFLLKSVSNERALFHLEIAATQHPDLPDCHIDLALVCQALGDQSRAADAFATARRIAPDYAVAQSKIADGLVRENRINEAFEACLRGVILFPNDAALLRKLIELNRTQDRWQDALPSWKRLLEIRPSCEVTHLAFGQACFERGEFQLAEATFARTLELKPDLLPALVNLALSRQKLQRSSEGIPCLEHALRLAPERPEIYKALGDLHRDLEHWTDAERAWRRAIELNPHYADAWQNLGLGLEREHRLEEALACHERVVELQPSDATAHRYLGMVCQDLHRFDRARAAYSEALRLAPNDPEAHWQMFSLLATSGSLQKAWIEHEWRWELQGRTTPKRQFPQPKWNGEQLTGRRILLHAEQGFGDTIQAVRYIPLVQSRGGIVLLWVPPELVRLMQSLPGVALVFSQLTPEIEFDVHLPLMSLPLVFESSVHTIPARVPYLQAPLDARVLPSGTSPRLNVGLVWSGSRSQPGDRRPVPFSFLAPLFEIAGVQFFSLQTGSAADDLKCTTDSMQLQHRSHRSNLDSHVVDLSPELHDFADTAGFIRQLDLVISIDTSVAHLAGALGTPVWLLTAYAPDWRWMRDRTDNPWYPTIRLFRQQQPGDWASVIAEVGQALSKLTEENSQTPPSVRAFLGRALVQHQAGQLGNAEFWYLRVLAMEPRQPDALRLLGLICRARGNLSGAQGWLEQAVECQPESALAHHDLGLIWSDCGRLDDAAAEYRRALELDPKLADAHYNLGNVWYAQKQIERAKRAYEAALELNPNLAEGHYNLGLIAQDAGATDTAAAHYRKTLALQPNHIDALQNLGVALKDQERFAEAEQYLRAVLEIAPGRNEARVNLAALLAAVPGRLDEAEELCRGVLATDQDTAEGWLNLGVIQQRKGNLIEALDSFRRALALQPENPDAEFNLGIAELLAGQYATGWQHYESRWRTRNPIFQQREGSSIPRWRGEAIHGRTIVVFAEQGYGDTIQFVRYLPLLAERGAEIVFECPDALLRLVQIIPCVRRVIRRGEPWPSADFQCPLMSLPLLLGPEMIPADVPYLRAPDEVGLVLPQRSGTLRVGIAWAGNRGYGNDRERSLTVREISRLICAEGFDWFSLQVGRADEVRTIQCVAPQLVDLEPHLRDFASTAAAIEQLDLVIGVDTAVAHLAGALAKPAFVLLPFAPDWRWQLGRTDCPWYPTFRLFRQETRGDWTAALNRAAMELTRMHATES